ncbi:ribosomal protein L30 [Candidozyma pseudohaemuli]|uniref:Large ribosomal subunit protein uL30m n=1 Tax=Candidozyma pseudohaemuli TaxID=418784 RepID=A0A2P7YZ34_9ASCO|nr:ribosomal protein L30 [[Candida] pseudohaemulonii]PSK41227.1 ribosomal protein L30 [[Candida] pseudohaemulonii]
MSKSLFYRITQLRSTIGMPPITRKNIKALGLRRRNQTVYQKVSAATAHRLRIVKELVSIDLLEENQVEDAKKLDKPQWAKGFTQVGNSTFALCFLLVGANQIVPCPVDSVHGNESVVDERLKHAQLNKKEKESS